MMRETIEKPSYRRMPSSVGIFSKPLLIVLHQRDASPRNTVLRRILYIFKTNVNCKTVSWWDRPISSYFYNELITIFRLYAQANKCLQVLVMIEVSCICARIVYVLHANTFADALVSSPFNT